MNSFIQEFTYNGETYKKISELQGFLIILSIAGIGGILKFYNWKRKKKEKDAIKWIESDITKIFWLITIMILFGFTYPDTIPFIAVYFLPFTFAVLKRELSNKKWPFIFTGILFIVISGIFTQYPQDFPYIYNKTSFWGFFLLYVIVAGLTLLMEIDDLKKDVWMPNKKVKQNRETINKINLVDEIYNTKNLKIEDIEKETKMQRKDFK